MRHSIMDRGTFGLIFDTFIHNKALHRNYMIDLMENIPTPPYDVSKKTNTLYVVAIDFYPKTAPRPFH